MILASSNNAPVNCVVCGLIVERKSRQQNTRDVRLADMLVDSPALPCCAPILGQVPFHLAATEFAFVEFWFVPGRDYALAAGPRTKAVCFTGGLIVCGRSFSLGIDNGNSFFN